MNKKLLSITVSLILVFTTAPLFTLSSDADAVQNTDSNMAGTRSSTNSVHYLYNYSYHDLYGASSLGYWDARWSPEYNSWAYGCKIAGGFNATGTYGFPSHGMIQAAAFGIDITSNEDNAYLSTINDDDFIWSTVQSSERTNIDEISLTLIGLVVSALGGGFGASLVWSTADLVLGALNNGYDTNRSSSKTLWYLWEWIPQINEADQTMSFTAYVRPGQTASFEANYNIFGQGFEVMTCGPMVLTITGASTNGAGDPSNMTIQERSENGIMTINKNDLQDYMTSKGYPVEYISDALNEDVKEYYFLTESDQYVTYQTTDTTCNKISDVYVQEYVENMLDNICNNNNIAHESNIQDTDFTIESDDVELILSDRRISL